LVKTHEIETWTIPLTPGRKITGDGESSSYVIIQYPGIRSPRAGRGGAGQGWGGHGGCILINVGWADIISFHFISWPDNIRMCSASLLLTIRPFVLVHSFIHLFARLFSQYIPTELRIGTVRQSNIPRNEWQANISNQKIMQRMDRFYSNGWMSGIYFQSKNHAKKQWTDLTHPNASKGSLFIFSAIISKI
jgi:hypothetical protein